MQECRWLKVLRSTAKAQSLGQPLRGKSTCQYTICAAQHFGIAASLYQHYATHGANPTCPSQPSGSKVGLPRVWVASGSGPSACRPSSGVSGDSGGGVDGPGGLHLSNWPGTAGHQACACCACTAPTLASQQVVHYMLFVAQWSKAMFCHIEMS